MTPKLTLSLTNYNQPLHLRLALAALERQSFKEFELVVADDGSGPEVRQVVEEGRKTSFFPITHLWQEDNGWRKNVMLNNVIRAARTDYIVFCDGDCLPSKHFLLDHWNEREERRMLLGRRVETSERWTRSLTIEDVRSGAFERYGWQELMDGVKGKALRLEDGVRIPSRSLRTLLLRDVTGMLGSNFSIARQDMVAINGFDEEYRGPGCGEDSDVQHRLSLVGVSGKSLRNLAVQYHLWHPFTRVSEANRQRLARTLASNDPQCRMGLQHL